MVENKNLEKILAYVHRKTYEDTSVNLVNNGEEHSYQGVLVESSLVSFEIWPDMKYKQLSVPPIAYDARLLEFKLACDISEWTDVADPKLEKRFKEVNKKFIDRCNEIAVGGRIEITYDRDLRIQRIGPEVSSKLPLIYYPFGFETYICEYSRIGFGITITPDVVEVKLAENS